MQSTQSGDIRWLSALMIDMVGSTEMAENLGSETAFSLLQELIDTASATIEAYGGYIIDFSGDSILAIYGAPLAVENATLVACQTALKLQEQLKSEADNLTRKYGLAPQYRIGIASGDAMIGTLEVGGESRLNAIGRALNLSARIQSLAGPGEVYLSAEAADEVAGYADLTLVGEFQHKGIAGKSKTYRLSSVRENQSSLAARIERGSGLYVGRNDLVGALSNWVTAEQPTHPLLTVLGPAGIGKSRLIEHAFRDLGSTIRVTAAYCTPTDPDATLRPLLAALRKAAEQDGITETSGREKWLSRLIGSEEGGANLSRLLVQSVDDTAGSSLDLGGRAAEIRTQLVDALTTIVHTPGRILLIEDIHWLDPLSREILATVVGKARAGAHLLLTCREYQTLNNGLENGNILVVAPLNANDTRAIVEAYSPGRTPSDALVNAVFERAEGNPLFTEEILRHLTRDGAVLTEGAIPSVAGIGSIQNLVFSRFDTLPSADKAFLKQAAVLGRLIKPAGLTSLAGGTSNAQGILERAQAFGLVEPVGKDGNWLFAHVLIQEAIIESIPQLEVRHLHKQAAEILLATSADNRGSIADALARHFDLAHDWAKAVEYHQLAAQGALAVYSLDVCLGHLRRAEALLVKEAPEIPDALFADVITTIARVFDISGMWVEEREIVPHHLDRLAAMAQKSPYILCQTLLAKAANQCGIFSEALAKSDEVLQFAQARGNQSDIARCLIVKMDVVNDIRIGEHHKVPELFEQTRAYAESGLDPHLAQLRFYEMSAYHRQEGNIPEALYLADQMIGLGKKNSDNRALTFGYWLKASIVAAIEEYEQAAQLAKESLKYAVPGTMDYAIGQVFLLGSRLMLGDDSIDADELEQNYANRRATGDMGGAVLNLFYASATHFKVGRIRAGLDALNRAEALTRDHAERGLLQQFFIKKAELMLTIAGRLPSPFPQPKVAASEIPTAVKLRLNALRLAAQSYDEGEKLVGSYNGFHGLRVTLGRALLNKSLFARKDTPEVTAAMKALDDIGMKDFVIKLRGL